MIIVCKVHKALHTEEKCPFCELDQLRRDFSAAQDRIHELTTYGDRCNTRIDILLSALKDSDHHGHASWCKAIKGPEHEEWYDDADCTCKWKLAQESK